MKHKISICITKKAVNYILKFLSKNPEKNKLHLGIKKYGCSGMSYTIKLKKKIKKNELLIKSNGIEIVIKKKYIPYFNGIKLDFIKNKNPNKGLYEGFKFYNPNIKNKCGCGKSFNI